MENKNTYIFISRIALEFRLSLKNACLILGKDTDEKNRMEVYSNIENAIGTDLETLDKLKYLFFYETLTESENVSKISFTRAVNYIKRYNNAKKSGDKEQIREVMKELKKTEKDFQSIILKIKDKYIGEDEATVIGKYRLKHAISRMRFCEMFDIARSTLEKKEKLISDEILKQKLVLLGEYYDSLGQNGKRKK